MEDCLPLCFQPRIHGTIQLVTGITLWLFPVVAHIAAEQATALTPPSLVQHFVPVPVLLVTVSFREWLHCIMGVWSPASHNGSPDSVRG